MVDVDDGLPGLKMRILEHVFGLVDQAAWHAMLVESRFQVLQVDRPGPIVDQAKKAGIPCQAFEEFNPADVYEQSQQHVERIAEGIPAMIKERSRK